MLKPDREIDREQLEFYLDDTSEPGVVLTVSTASSGADMDGSDNVAEISADPSGKTVLGVLLDEFVDIDLSQYPLNPHKPQQQKGGKASIARRGWLVTDKVLGTPSAGDVAVAAESGNLRGGTASDTTPKVGRFLTSQDEDGFAKVEIDP